MFFSASIAYLLQEKLDLHDLEHDAASSNLTERKCEFDGFTHSYESEAAVAPNRYPVQMSCPSLRNDHFTVTTAAGDTELSSLESPL
jgi:hypothetical protein